MNIKPEIALFKLLIISDPESIFSVLRIFLLYCWLYTREEGRFFLNFHFADTALAKISL